MPLHYFFFFLNNLHLTSSKSKHTHGAVIIYDQNKRLIQWPWVWFAISVKREGRV